MNSGPEDPKPATLTIKATPDIHQAYHISSFVSKASHLGILHHTKSFLGNQLLSTNKAFIQSLMEHCSPLWKVYNAFLELVQKGSIINGNRSSNIIFLDAPGGTGKSFVINTILKKIHSGGKIALATVSSGIAATLLQGG